MEIRNFINKQIEEHDREVKSLALFGGLCLLSLAFTTIMYIIRKFQ